MQATAHTEIFVPLEGVINLTEQIDRIQKDINKTRAEFEKVEKKLNNPKFMQNAPDDVVAEVKGKAEDFGKKLESLNLMLENFQ